MSSSKNIQIATQILDQIGGNKFATMTGLSHQTAIENGVQFGFKGSRRLNFVKIVLNGLDLYDMEFSQWSPLHCKLTVKANHVDVYNDMLANIFENETGLRTSL